MSRTALVLSLLAAACSEYEITPEPQHARVENPPIPENRIQTDRVVQVTEPAVDVLFVVDNSCSMDAEQNALANNFPVFLDYFEGSGLDWHIGVVSTDMDDPDHSGKLRQAAGVRYLERETPNPEVLFQQMAVMGTGGASDEKGRAAVYTALELRRDGPRNVGFYREDASLHLVFISDEDDHSAANPIARQEFGEWLRDLKYAPDLVHSHGIIWVPGQPCADAFEPGTAYANYAQWTGGILFDICEDDWNPFMDELGLQTTGLKREFFLSKIPVLDPWTLDVKVEIDQGPDLPPNIIGFDSCMAGEACSVQYNPGRNSISFVEYIPPPLSVVHITYTVAEQYSATP
ncbi:MAG: hypothetical protein R3F61_20515 [Myxococcota bacterium]